MKAFSGVGRVLGNPTPKVVTSASNFHTKPPELLSQASSVDVDESKPTTQLQIRLPDGSRYRYLSTFKNLNRLLYFIFSRGLIFTYFL